MSSGFMAAGGVGEWWVACKVHRTVPEAAPTVNGGLLQHTNCCKGCRVRVESGDGRTGVYGVQSLGKAWKEL